MPNVEHSTLTGADLHEPKGAATASLGQVYVSNGAGSGTWMNLYTSGTEDYDDTGTPQSLATSYTDLTNDGLGPNTNTSYKIPTSTGIWNTSSSEFDWQAGGLSLGDTVLIRFDFTVTTVSNGDSVTTALDIAHGDVAETELEVDYKEFKNSGVHRVVFDIEVYMGSTAILENPAKVKMKSDNASNSVVVNDWVVTSIPRKPVLHNA